LADTITGKIYAAILRLKNMVEMVIERVDFLENRSINKKLMTTARLDQRVALHATIDEHFNVDEMKDLYYKCGLNYEDETGDKSTRIWRLIDFYSKREKLLAKKCKKERPSIDWPFLD